MDCWAELRCCFRVKKLVDTALLVVIEFRCTKSLVVAVLLIVVTRSS